MNHDCCFVTESRKWYSQVGIPLFAGYYREDGGQHAGFGTVLKEQERSESWSALLEIGIRVCDRDHECSSDVMAAIALNNCLVNFLHAILGA